MSHRSSPRSGAAWFVLSSALFALMAVAVRVAGSQVPLGQLVALRFGVGAVGVGLWFALRRKPPHAARPGALALRGFFGALAVLCYFYAIDHVGVGPATMMTYASPIYGSLFAALFLREKVTVHAVGGLFIATVGVGLVAWGSLDVSRPLELGLGIAAGMASAVFAGAALTAMRSLRRDTDAASIYLAFCLVGLLASLPVAAATWRPMSLSGLGWALVVGLLSLAAQLLMTYAFGFVSVMVGSAVQQLTPVMAWTFAVMFLGEHLDVMRTVGAVLCVGGVLWTARYGTPNEGVEARPVAGE